MSKYETIKVAGVDILMGTLKYPQARVFSQKYFLILLIPGIMLRDGFFFFFLERFFILQLI